MWWIFWPILALVVAIILFLIVYFVLAPRNLWWTFVKEGTTKIVVKGDQFNKALIQWKDYTFDKDWNVVKNGTAVPEDVKKEIKQGQIKLYNFDQEEGVYREPRHLFGGLRFYGFWPIKDIYIYRFTWTGVKENGEIDRHPTEILDYILLKSDIYWCQLVGAEEKELLPLTIELISTVGIKNPYKALFKIENWLEAVINRIKPSIRDYVAKSGYKVLVKKKEAMGGKLHDGMENLRKEFEEKYGVDIQKIEVKDIKPPKEQLEATLKKWSAEREKEAIIIKAEAEATRIETEWGRIKKFKELGTLIRTLEAIEKSPLAASLTVQVVPGLSEAFRGVFGKPLPEGITQKQWKGLQKELKNLKSLREEIEKIKKIIESLPKQ